ncbi:Nibrin [Geodia barretti]|nr:Nibrin [Geodia barretti]
MVVGRKDCDILLSGDGSVSRRHATLCVSEGNPGVVTVTDCKSKFGTAVNGKRMGASQKLELKQNDIVTFGQGVPSTHSRFRLVYEPLVFCCSAMSKPESVRLKQEAGSLGAEVVSSWSHRCSHLIMTNITVTVKVVCALSSCKPVVSPDWVREAVRCRRSSLPLPAPSAYQPQVVDSNLAGCGEDRQAVLFAPDYNRTALFKDRVFYFLSEKQLGRLRSCLEPAGATLRLVSSPQSASLDSLVARDAVVLALDGDLVKQATPPEQKWIKQVYLFLKSHDVRAVQDSEIGFALLYTSTEEYCNPRASPKMPASNTPMAPPTLSQAPPSQPHSSHHHTLPFTQEPEPGPCGHTTILAPDSIDQSQPGPSHAKGRTSSCSALKVNETVFPVKSPSDKSPLVDKSSVLVKTEEPSEAITDVTHLPSKIPVKQPRGKDKRPPEATSTAANASSIAPAAPKTAVQPSESAANKEVKAEPLDFLFGDEDEEEVMEEGPAPPLVGRGERQEGGEAKRPSPNEQGYPHDHHEIVPSPSIPAKSDERAPSSELAKKRQSPNASSLVPSSPSQPEEGSVIVPCSLTPRTQDKSKKPPLPDSQTLAFAFGGRRKKRPVNETSEDAENQSKKKKVEEERGKKGEEGDGDGEMKGSSEEGEIKEGAIMSEGVEEVSKCQRSEGGKEVRSGLPQSTSVGNGGANAPSVGLFSGLKSKRGSGRAKSTTSAPSTSKHQQLPPIMAGLPLLETCDDNTTTNGRSAAVCGNTNITTAKTEKEPSLAQEKLDYQNERIKQEPEDVEMEIEASSDTPVPRPNPSPPPTTQITQAAPPTTPDPTLFLSARNRRRKSQRDDVTPTPAPPPPTSSSRAASPHTQLTTQATQRSRMFTPFTSLVATGGRRTKASDQEHTSLWEEVGRDQLDGEDPLVNTANEEAPKKVYKPVCDENGFVCSRVKPRVQTSRAGRLAAFADSQLSDHSDMPDAGGGGEEEEVGMEGSWQKSCSPNWWWWQGERGGRGGRRRRARRTWDGVMESRTSRNLGR